MVRFGVILRRRLRLINDWEFFLKAFRDKFIPRSLTKESMEFMELKQGNLSVVNMLISLMIF